jgi:hypothetical protein
MRLGKMMKNPNVNKKTLVGWRKALVGKTHPPSCWHPWRQALGVLLCNAMDDFFVTV